MPSNRCVVQGCSNQSDPKNGISLHLSPTDKTECAKWKRFVDIHSANFEPQNRFVVCSKHFEGSCFERVMNVQGIKRFLIKGSVPTIWFPAGDEGPNDNKFSDRTRRKVGFADCVNIINIIS